MKPKELFAEEMSNLIGQRIKPDDIHSSTGRFYYIQMPKTGSPMLLHHYRGPFCVDLNPVDYNRIVNGEVSPHEYIYKANWLVGYFWGGGSMIGGGYYQPLDIIGRNEEVRRYLKILACRGSYRACGYMPTNEDCSKCELSDCPFSTFSHGDWSKEISESDPRKDFFNSLLKRFENENPGYTLRGFICGDIPDNEIWIRPNYRFKESEEKSFVTYASRNLIQDLLMREKQLNECDVYSFIFRLWDTKTQKSLPVNEDTLYEAFKEDDSDKVSSFSEDAFKEEKVSLGKRIINFFRRMF